jgi:ABC-type phosphate/phosphonate transport system substrate-binding protein
MERWSLYKQGIMISQIARIQFTDMPHDKAVLEVLNGTADVAFVRTGILEGMAHDGSIRIDQFKVLNRQPLARFPQLLSTDLYPEWPFAAMPNVPDDLAKYSATESGRTARQLFRVFPAGKLRQSGSRDGTPESGSGT